MQDSPALYKGHILDVLDYEYYGNLLYLMRQATEQTPSLDAFRYFWFAKTDNWLSLPDTVKISGLHSRALSLYWNDINRCRLYHFLHAVLGWRYYDTTHPAEVAFALGLQVPKIPSPLDTFFVQLPTREYNTAFAVPKDVEKMLERYLSATGAREKDSEIKNLLVSTRFHLMDKYSPEMFSHRISNKNLLLFMNALHQDLYAAPAITIALINKFQVLFNLAVTGYVHDQIFRSANDRKETAQYNNLTAHKTNPVARFSVGTNGLVTGLFNRSDAERGSVAGNKKGARLPADMKLLNSVDDYTALLVRPGDPLPVMFKAVKYHYEDTAAGCFLSCQLMKTASFGDLCHDY